MPRKAKSIPGPSRLSKILLQLNKAPKPNLVGLKSLKLTLAAKNDHFGARHFLKEDMPRIRYTNPNLNIEVNRLPKAKEETWKPEMMLEFRNGKTQTLNLDKKWSWNIFKDLMEAAGGTSWARWKAEREAAGLPIVEGAPPNPSPFASSSPKPEKTGAAAVLP
ncbi:hypothetical protein EW146_g6238 [Bondarzewia mesenterica]|uniref:Ribosomal protein/NADH dehydrogenase domain-containing protein n=1 Tax=Bondarzewia mesenterica TaxID=1095465 RepID=A0A4S4LPA9_9AGAM|nr:hypothetical protein EW146_g6238 [Bondarzewia mesenterica]